MCELAAQPGTGFSKAQIRRLYHQAGGPEDMYGAMQGERWRDGLVASCLRSAAASAEATWLIFDGFADSPILEGTAMVSAASVACLPQHCLAGGLQVMQGVMHLRHLAAVPETFKQPQGCTPIARAAVRGRGCAFVTEGPSRAMSSMLMCQPCAGA